MFIGALLDGLPESFVLGITLALGGTINIAFLAAVFVSNIPQGVAGTTSSMIKRPRFSSDRRILTVKKSKVTPRWPRLIFKTWQS